MARFHNLILLVVQNMYNYTYICNVYTYIYIHTPVHTTTLFPLLRPLYLALQPPILLSCFWTDVGHQQRFTHFLHAVLLKEDALGWCNVKSNMTTDSVPFYPAAVAELIMTLAAAHTWCTEVLSQFIICIVISTIFSPLAARGRCIVLGGLGRSPHRPLSPQSLLSAGKSRPKTYHKSPDNRSKGLSSRCRFGCVARPALSPCTSGYYY